MRRSRSGLSSKIHLLADSGCRPLARVMSSGQRHDSLAFEPLMSGLRIARRGPGRPRTRPGRVLGDKAYSSSAIRAHLRRRKIKATVPQPAEQVASRRRRGSAGGRAAAFDAAAYKQRNTVERAFAKLRQTAPSPPGSTNATSSGAEPSTSPRSGSGYALCPMI